MSVDFGNILFTNGKILCFDSRNTQVESMLVLHGKIAATGSSQEIRQLWRKKYSSKEKSLQEVDLEQNWAYPGFIDAHLHPITNIKCKTYVNCKKFASFSEFKAKIKHYSDQRETNEWIVAFKFNERNFTKPENQLFPTRDILDYIAPLHPFVLYRYDLHIICLNSVALEKLGMDKQPKPLPLGWIGEIRCDQGGAPNGQMTEDATKFVDNYIPIPTKSQLLIAQKEFASELAQFGITSVGGVMNENDIPILESLDYLENFPLDIAAYFNVEDPEKLGLLNRRIQEKSKISDHFTVTGLKRFMDGSFGAQTALMHEPYSNSHTKSAGILVTDIKRLESDIKLALTSEFDVMVHAIGDKANAMLVDSMANILEDFSQIPPFWKKSSESSESLESAKYRPVRMRIEHASMLIPNLVEKMAKYNIIPVCQPEFIRSEAPWIGNFIGENRVKHLYPFKLMLDHGLKLAGSSDSPVESTEVLVALQDCVLRFGLNSTQGITLPQAIQMYTSNSSYAIGQEHLRGSLEQGKYADFFLTDKNLFETAPEQLREIKILKTYVRGNCIYKRTENY
ncbi:MAG: amidohydrolase [Promethearchaeota archaeon]